MDPQHYWEITLHYSRIYHTYAIFVEGFDKLISLFSNVSTPTTQTLLHSAFLSLMSAEPRPTNLRGIRTQPSLQGYGARGEQNCFPGA